MKVGPNRDAGEPGCPGTGPSLPVNGYVLRRERPGHPEQKKREPYPMGQAGAPGWNYPTVFNALEFLLGSNEVAKTAGVTRQEEHTPNAAVPGQEELATF